MAAVLALGLLGAGAAGTAVYRLDHRQGELVITTVRPPESRSWLPATAARSSSSTPRPGPASRSGRGYHPEAGEPRARGGHLAEQLTIERGGVVVAKVVPAAAHQRPVEASPARPGRVPPRRDAAPAPPPSLDGQTLTGQEFSVARRGPPGRDDTP